MIPGRQRTLELNHGAPDHWKKISVSRCDAVLDRSDQPLVYAIISTWYDGDIVAATVKNCFDNGCTRVFVLDNDSPDNSVAAAVEAGAEIAEVYHTEYYDDDLRIRKQNEFIKHIVETSNYRELWFLCLDGDELPTGHCGETVQQTLGRLPGEIRTIGSNAIDLYPSRGEKYVIGEHPAIHFANGINRTAKFACAMQHWKHVALRYFNCVFDIAQSRGNHLPFAKHSNVRIREPHIELPIFHAPIRNQEEATARLIALCAKPKDGKQHRSAGDDAVIGGQGAIKRFKSLEYIFTQQWDKVELPHSQMYGREITGVCTYPWRVLKPELSHMYGREKTTNPNELVVLK